MHIIVSYYPGNIYCYINGELVYKDTIIQGDFRNWDPANLLFGNEYNGERSWKGTLEHISIYNRFIGKAEAAKKFMLLQNKIPF